MSYDKNPFDPYERIGTTGGVPGTQSSAKRRRRFSISPGYLALAVAALLIVYGLWWRDRDKEAQAGEPSETSAGTALVLDAPRDAPAHKGPAQVAKAPQKSQALPKTHPGLSREVDIVVSEWMSKARKISKGKVTGKNTIVAVHVRDLEGHVLVDRNTARALAPASNQKILTGASAVILAQENDRFVTRFEALGEITGGELRGDLVVRAGADPLYREGSDGGLEPWLDPLVEQLKAAGIQAVTGRVVLDEGDYQTPGPAIQWPSPDQHWLEFCALAGGFSANAGCMSATIQAGQVGSNATVKIRPRGHGLKRKSSERVTTVKRGSKLIVAVEARGSRLVVRGKIPADVPTYKARFAHPDPVELFGHGLIAGLERGGIAVAKGFERVRNAQAGKPVATIESPLEDSLVPVLTKSNNSVADQIYLWLGHKFGGEGTAKGGAKAVAMALDRMKVDTSGMVLVDGSGLSKANRVRADQLTAVLAGVYQRQDGLAMAFRRALPVAGKTGSLSKRMRDGLARGNVSAKTGWVKGSSSLSGFVQTKGGKQLVFSILVHYPDAGGMNNQVFKPMQDEICERLAAFGSGGQ